MSIHDTLERTKLPLFIVVLIPILGALYVFFGSNVSSPVQTSATTEQPTTQPSTSAPAAPPAATIALNDPSSLPQSVTEAQLVPFSFTVQNPSSQDATYQYKVSVHWSTGEDDVIDENVLSLTAGTSQTISEALKFEIATETAEVSFDLPQTGQTVQFTLPRK